MDGGWVGVCVASLEYESLLNYEEREAKLMYCSNQREN